MPLKYLLIAFAALAGSAHAQDMADLTAASRTVSAKLIAELGAQLKGELAKGGPEGAVSVCKTIAPDIAARLSRTQGSRIARVSLKARNPLLGFADAWEQRALAEFDRRAAAGEKPETLEFSEIVDEPSRRFFRYVKAIPVQPLCLTCHGTPDTIPEPVQQRLREEYPHDRATGYSAGQIRGAVSVQQPL